MKRLKIPRELRLVAPIVGCWLALVAVAATLAILSDSGTTSRWALFAVSVTASAGSAMALIWCTLYRRTRWVPILLCFLLLVGALTAIYRYARPRGWDDESFMFFGVLPVVAILVGLVAVVAARTFLGWRIIEQADSMGASKRHFSLSSFFGFITVFAMAFGALMMFDVPFEREMVFVAFGVCLPSVWIAALLTSMSRFPIRPVWPIALLIVMVAAAAICGMASLMSPLPPVPLGERSAPRPGLLQGFFLPSLLAYAYIALLLLVAATYLRRHGILFQFGGTAGFGAPRKDSRPVPWRAVAVGATVAVGLITVVGGWFYYPQWVLTKWTIPEEPATSDLPRLLQVAGHYAASNTDSEELNAINDRRRAAQEAITRIGSDAVPFLLEKLTDPSTDEEHNRLRETAGESLSELARNEALGPHKGDVVDAIVGLLNSRDPNVLFPATTLLLAIGMPDAGPALPAVERACLAADDVTSNLFYFFVRLDRARAIPTLMQILQDKDKYDLAVRARAARAFAQAEADNNAAVTFIVDLLREGTDRSKAQGTPSPELISMVQSAGTVRAAEAVPLLTELLQEEPQEPYLQRVVVEALGEIGPAAEASIADLEVIADRTPAPREDQELSSAAVIAMSRIRLTQPAIGTSWILNRLKKGLDALDEYGVAKRADAAAGSGYREFSGADWENGPLTKAYFGGLMLLGAQNDPEIMQHTATPSWNSEALGAMRLLRSSPVLPRTAAAIEAAIYRQQSQALPNAEWTADGKILGLASAMSVGLEASDPAVRATAADILAVLAPLTASAIPALQHCLDDDDADVRMRVAAALVLSGDESDEVKEALIESVSEVGDDLPKHIRELVNKAL